jgi:hypothetical protein
VASLRPSRHMLGYTLTIYKALYGVKASLNDVTNEQQSFHPTLPNVRSSESIVN